MEKNTKILIIVIATVILCSATFVGALALSTKKHMEKDDAGLTNIDGQGAKEEVVPVTVEELYPYETFDMNAFLNFKPDTLYIFENEKSGETYELFFSSMKENKYVGFLSNGEVFFREEAYTTKDEFIVHNLSSGLNLTELVLTSNENTDVENLDALTILKAPFEVGNTWESGENTFVIEEVTEDYVAVKGKTLDGKEKKIYFKEGIGIYKFIEYIDDVEEVYELKEASNEVHSIPIEVSYIDVNTLEGSPVDVDVKITTNDTIENVINNLFLNVPEGYASPLPEGAKILSLRKEEGADFVHVDFSEEFETNRNFGSGLEAESLACIADTFGELYNVDKVKITVAGRSYESGHFALEDDMITR